MEENWSFVRQIVFVIHDVVDDGMFHRNGVFYVIAGTGKSLLPNCFWQRCRPCSKKENFPINSAIKH